MRRLYVGHATREFDYQANLYQPLTVTDALKDYQLILPHKAGAEPIKSEDLFKQSKGDLIFLADLTAPSTGLGMEIAWARQYHVPVIFSVKSGIKPTSAVKFVWEGDESNYRLVEYDGAKKLIDGLKHHLEEINSAPAVKNGLFS